MKLSSDILIGIFGRLSDDPDGMTSGGSVVSKRAILSRLGSRVLIPVTIVKVTGDSFGIINLAPIHKGEQFDLRVTGRNGNRLVARCLVIACTRTASKRFWIDAEVLDGAEEDGD
jgi:hypothetical protein